MDQGNPPRKIVLHHGRRFRRRGRHLRGHADRGPPPRAERRKRIHGRRPEHVLQPRIGHLQPGRIFRERVKVRRQVQQLQDEGARLPLLPRHAAVRLRPPLDFQCRAPDAAARVPAHVPRDCRLDQAAAACLPRLAPHGSATDNTLPVPRHVGRTALRFPLRALAVHLQVGLPASLHSSSSRFPRFSTRRISRPPHSS